MRGETRAHHGSSWLKYSETVASGEDLDALIKRAQEGDVRAFEALLAGHLPRVRRFARAFSSSDTDADDLAQEALLKVYRSLKLFRYQAAFSTWLYAVVRNVFLDGRGAVPGAIGSGRIRSSPSTGKWPAKPPRQTSASAASRSGAACGARCARSRRSSAARCAVRHRRAQLR